MSESEKMVNCGECVHWLIGGGQGFLGECRCKHTCDTSGRDENEHHACSHFALSPLARIAEALERAYPLPVSSLSPEAELRAVMESTDVEIVSREEFCGD